jgi:peptidyl-tRNA hydrolase, PTH2 family
MNETTKAFLAGALLPTIAIYFLRHKLLSNPIQVSGTRGSVKVGDDDDNNNADCDDDNDDSSGQLSLEDDDDREEIKADLNASLPCRDWGMIHAPYKMVLCVNTDLNMGKGKIAAQCCHAAVGCYKRSTKHCPSAIRAWEYTGCAKIALKCPTVEELEIIAAKARSVGIPFYLVEDAGRTQIAAGSRTVLGLFGPASVFEGVTDHLKLM